MLKSDKIKLDQKQSLLAEETHMKIIEQNHDYKT
jgi:hypothetical protein